VSFQLAKGKTLGLVGESGSGKTTIGLLLMRLHEATGGQALIGGKDILAMTEKEFSQYQRKIQIIFQNPYASLNPRFTIGQILLEPMRIHGIGQNDAERKKLHWSYWNESAYLRKLMIVIRMSFQVGSGNGLPLHAV
jgi:peptide/nickel transport system ATP-binding protein